MATSGHPSSSALTHTAHSQPEYWDQGLGQAGQRTHPPCQQVLPTFPGPRDVCDVVPEVTHVRTFSLRRRHEAAFEGGVPVAPEERCMSKFDDHRKCPLHSTTDSPSAWRCSQQQTHSCPHRRPSQLKSLQKPPLTNPKCACVISTERSPSISFSGTGVTQLISPLGH